MDAYRIQEALDVLLTSEPQNMEEWSRAIQTLNELINRPVFDQASCRRESAELFSKLWNNGASARRIYTAILTGEESEESDGKPEGSHVSSASQCPDGTGNGNAGRNPEIRAA